MISIFEYDNYRKFLAKRLSEMPNKGYGQMSLLARHLGVHTTLVSQILKEHKELTTDQAASAAEFFGLSDLEAEYFVLLTQLSRAGNAAAKKIYQKQLQRLKEQSQNLSKRLKSEGKLSDEQRAVFYSDWAYSAIRQSVSIPGIHSVDTVSEYLGLARKKVQSYLEFLIKTGLCKSSQGTIKPGPASTHVESTSPWVRVHHTNWRQRAIQSLDRDRPGNLNYTCPLTLSKKDADIVKERIIQLIEEVNSVVDPSPSETLYCLNIDWFQEGK